MILAFNTLEEASNYLHSETKKNWTQREIIQACLDYGIFLHIQILTDRLELPLWMREGGVAELPFNVDLLTFLTGTGVVQILRRDNLIYKIEPPGLICDFTNLRLSKDALNKLLACYRIKNDTQIQSKKEQRKKEILRIIRDELGLDPLKLPQIIQGKPWVKLEVKSKLNLPTKLFTKNSFDDAWEELRKSEQLKEENNPPIK